jgi:hypothetical protein
MLGLERHCIAASSGVARASRDEMWRTNTRERAPHAVAARLFVRADGRKRPRDAPELFFFRSSKNTIVEIAGSFK